MAAKMLIIDNEEVVLESCRKIFSKEGYKVEIISSPANGLKLIEDTNFDVVLCDWKMPEFDGMDVVEEISEAVKRAVQRKGTEEQKALGRLEKIVKQIQFPVPSFEEKAPGTIAETYSKIVLYLKICFTGGSSFPSYSVLTHVPQNLSYVILVGLFIVAQLPAIIGTAKTRITIDTNALVFNFEPPQNGVNRGCLTRCRADAGSYQVILLAVINKGINILLHLPP